MGKDVKKHKKEKRKKNEHENEEEWVEKDTGLPAVPKIAVPKIDEVKKEPVRDEWMSMESIFSGPSISEKRAQREAEKQKTKEAKLDKPGQSVQELNPYWKDGGTGLPSQDKNDIRLVKNSIGDHGSEWLKKALTRAKEQAAEENRSLDEVVQERYGSLDNLNKMINEAEKREQRGFKRNYRDNSRRHLGRQSDSESFIRRNRSPRRDRYGKYENSERRKERFKKPDSESDSEMDRDSQRKSQKYDESRRKRKSFKKPNDSGSDGDHKYNSNRRRDTHKKREGNRSQERDSEDHKYKGSHRYSHSSTSGEPKRGWRKPNVESTTHSKESKQENPATKEEKSNSEERVVKKEEPVPEGKVLSLNERNALGAKAMKAELMGNKELAAQLRAEMELSTPRNKTSGVILVTETDNRGFVRPVKRGNGGDSRSRGKKRVATHENNERVRYFPDDDKYSLQDMFENEKFNSSERENATFLKLMGKELARKDGSLALDDPFEETASIDNSSKEGKKNWVHAIREQKRRDKVYENCKWCLTGEHMRQDIIIKAKNKVYLSVPPFQSLTEGHCLIVPNYHVSCSTQVDEDVWEEIQELRKEIVSMFEAEEEDVVIFESASFLNKHPHMILHCVPVPKEIGDMAPIYFKKAILECETEWSNNKKVVELAGRNVRKAVPKGLPYFAVDFGMQSGYAHVIEDEQMFPRNFAQEIIGGMLDIDHTIWRKQRFDADDVIEKKKKYLQGLLEKK